VEQTQQRHQWLNAWSRSIRIRVVLFILISGLIPMFFVGWFIHDYASETLVRQHSVDLSNLAASQSEILESHINHIVEDAELLAMNNELRSFMIAYQSGNSTDELYTCAGRVMAQMQDARWGDIHHVMLTDLSGQVIMNPPVRTWTEPGISAAVMRETNGPHVGESLRQQPKFEQAKTGSVLTDLFGFEERDHYHQLVMTPVRDEDGNPLGVVSIEIVISRLVELLNTKWDAGENSIFLATLDGVRVVENKGEFDPTPMHLPGLYESVEQSSTRTGWFHDDQGERILGAYHPSAAYPWVVCVEKPEGAAMKSAAALTRMIMLILSLGLVALALLAYFIGSALCLPIRKLVNDSARVSGGELEHRIAITRQDELGQLQGSVDHMRVSLKRQIDHLDAIVSARTRELEQANRQLAIDARQDKLTGLANREVLLDRVRHALAMYRRDPGRQFSVLFFDFDRFKIVNDSLGHAMGDALLCSIADRFRELARESDLVARFGGDEFVVCLGKVDSPEDALQAAERMLRVFEKAHEIRGHRIVSTASIGLVTVNERYQDAGEMIRDADAAMYEAKLAGKGQVVVFDEKMHDEAQTRIRIEEDLSRSIERGQLRVVYQPIVGMDELALVGFEALIRWEHPQLGLVRPDHFIPIAEDTGFIVEIGEWIMRESLAQLHRWDEQFGTTSLTMNVNVAKRQLIHPNFIPMVRSALDESRIAHERLKLEITESTVIDPRHDMSQTIREVHNLGVQIAMDDFGTGHSSLSLLHQFDLDVIKIDKSFIQGMGDSREMSAVLHAIIALTQNMGKRVVAEGVETEEQIACLISHGCDMVQGYYFAKPLGREEAGAYINNPIKKPRAA
jgi:diguanylate cyclase (GGDEF)-like protein